MRNILLPTDLSLPSLYPIHEIGRTSAGHKCRVYLVHTLAMPTGITELLFLKKPFHQVPAAFIGALDILRRRYSGIIETIHFDFVYGNNRNYLRQYMEAREIQTVYILKDHEYDLPLLQSTDCRLALWHCDVPITRTMATADMGFGTLTTLLYHEKKHA
jgi:hypothetical protein